MLEQIGSNVWSTYFKEWEMVLRVIMITSPYDLDPLTPHFYIVKLGFTGVYIIYLFLL